MSKTRRAKTIFTAEFLATCLNLPSDAKVHTVKYNPQRACFEAYFFSDIVDSVNEGQETPEWMPPPRYS